MEEKRKKPKYNPLQNSCYMAGRAWREAPLILPLAAGMVLAGIAANLLELLAAPAVLRSVERGDSPAALVRLVLAFTLAMILVYGGRAYLDANTIFSRVHLRLKLSSDVHSKFCRTAYPHLLDTDFLQKADRAMAPTNGNMDAGEAVWDTLTDLTVHSVSFAVYLLLLAGLEPVLLAVTVISAGASYWAGLGLRRWRYRHRKEEEQIGHKVLYIHRSAAKRTLAKDIRIFGLRDWLMELWTENLTLLRDFRAKAERMELLADCLDILATLLRNGAAYYYLLRLAVGGGLSAAEFVLYFSAATGLGAWTGSILQDINTLNRQSGELSILREFLEEPEPFRFDEGEPLTPQPGHLYTLELRDVSFRYPGGEKDVLHQVNLTIRPGERLAIVGLNGAGKTTMIRLLCGFLDPTEGQVLLDGVDIRRYDRRDYYRLIGAVFQQSSILAGTIGENVAQCPGDYDRQRAEQCLAWADLTEKLHSLPAGLDTNLDRTVYEDAVELSGGETQRLLLARALYRQAPILVLDEPTAALDPITESSIYQKYNEMTSGCTSIYISHRLASTRFCDRIILVEGGAIAEEGTHDQLMAMGGTYAGLFAVQSKYYQEEVDRRGEN